MGKASSSKKVARVAKVGGKAGHRTTRQFGYPLSVAALIIIGLALVTFVKVRRTAADNSPPRQTVVDASGNVTKPGDHFHEAIGFYVCGTWVPNLSDATTPTNGIHTLGDGIIDIQPTVPEAAGKNAKLGLFLTDVGVTISDDAITFPPGVKVPGANPASSSSTTTPSSSTTSSSTSAPTTTTTAPASSTTAAGSSSTTAAPASTTSTTTAPPAHFSTSGTCHGKPAVLRVAEWTESFGSDGRTPTTSSPAHLYSSNFADIRLDNDLASLTVYYGPTDVKIPVPKSTPNLLHLQDIGQSPSPATTVPGVPTTVLSPSTPGSSPSSVPTSSSTAPASTAAGSSATSTP